MWIIVHYPEMDHGWNVLRAVLCDLSTACVASPSRDTSTLRLLYIYTTDGVKQLFLVLNWFNGRLPFPTEKPVFEIDTSDLHPIRFINHQTCMD